jgi:uncharacterized protein YjbJ (UPF0337 family)
MNREWREGLRKQLRGALHLRWGALVGDPRRRAAGAREQLEGRIQARHGAAQYAAQRQLRQFQARHRNWFDLSN